MEEPHDRNINGKRKGKTVSFIIVENEKMRRMPMFSVLDTKPSHILDFPLTVKQQLWFIFLLPTVWLTIIYIADVATDLAVGLELINEGHFIPGSITISIVFLPPLLSYFIRLSAPPDTKEVKVVFTWFAVETAAFVLFPIRPIQCFAERLFWSIEAIKFEDPHREDALIAFEQTRAFVIENYMFMQALLQAGPQAILQIFLLLLHTSHHYNTEVVQMVCLMTSLASLALITSTYQRYETQVRGGRHQVWASKDRSLTTLLNNSEENLELQQSRHRWVKVMDEDNPVGSILSFLFWFLFLFGRVLCLAVAFLFFPSAVLSVCAAHYIFSLAYILPYPDCKSSIATKILLAFVYIFCLIEVGIQFRKSRLWYSLFFFFSVVENISLTLLWALWAKWNSEWYILLSLYLMGISHAMALIFLIIYLKYFKPKIRRIEVF